MYGMKSEVLKAGILKLMMWVCFWPILLDSRPSLSRAWKRIWALGLLPYGVRSNSSLTYSLATQVFELAAVDSRKQDMPSDTISDHRKEGIRQHQQEPWPTELCPLKGFESRQMWGAHEHPLAVFRVLYRWQLRAIMERIGCWQQTWVTGAKIRSKILRKRPDSMFVSSAHHPRDSYEW